MLLRVPDCGCASCALLQQMLNVASRNFARALMKADVYIGAFVCLYALIKI